MRGVPFVIGLIVFIVLNMLGNTVIGKTVCNDGWRSPSIGVQGACSHHGGVKTWPGTVAFFLSIGGGIFAGAWYSERSKKRNSEVIKDKGYVPSKSVLDPCPVCGSPMVKRTARRGKWAGKGGVPDFV